MQHFGIVLNALFYYNNGSSYNAYNVNGINLRDAQEVNSNTIIIDQSTYGSAIYVYQEDSYNIDLSIENNHIEFCEVFGRRTTSNRLFL